MTLVSPERLILLLGVAALAVLYAVLQYRRQQYVVRFTNMELLDQVAPRRPGWRRHLVAGGATGLDRHVGKVGWGGLLEISEQFNRRRSGREKGSAMNVAMTCQCCKARNPLGSRRIQIAWDS